jgi:hypothetical protein
LWHVRLSGNMWIVRSPDINETPYSCGDSSTTQHWSTDLASLSRNCLSGSHSQQTSSPTRVIWLTEDKVTHISNWQQK